MNGDKPSDQNGSPNAPLPIVDVLELSAASLFDHQMRAPLCLGLMDHLALSIRGLISETECRRWVEAILAAREVWTPCFEGVQFTLGRAWYTHLEEDRVDEYFEDAPASDLRVEQILPGFQAKMRSLANRVTANPVYARPGYCGSGIHIFPAGGWLSKHGGDIHFDTEGLTRDQRQRRCDAFTCVLMLQAPTLGGGLRLWNRTDDGTGEATRDSESTVITYRPGDVVVLDSYRLHQIQPFVGFHDRISATLHAVQDGGWQTWF